MPSTTPAPLMSAAALACLVVTAQGHSWVACTDYRGDVNYFEQERCLAWPRQWWSRGELNAPRANGYQIADGDGRAWANGGCDIPMSSPWKRGYTSAYPNAVYEPGKVYCMAWPMKNHARAEPSCENPHAKSDAAVNDSLTLFVSSLDPSVDPLQAEFNRGNINELAGLATGCNPEKPGSREAADECQLGLEKQADGQADCKGFQRAPKFCQNTGESMGTGCFQVPASMTPGHYVAQWFWKASFIRGSIHQPISYTSCFDFEVVTIGSERVRTGATGTTGEPDSLLPCQNNMLKFSSGTGARSTSTTAAGTTVQDQPQMTRATTTPAPAPQTSAGPCQGPHALCAGDGFGPECCTAGHVCTLHEGGPWGRCLPAAPGTKEPEPEPVPSPAPAGTTVAPTSSKPAGPCHGAYEHCAGEGFGPECCVAGHFCSLHNEGPWGRCFPSSHHFLQKDARGAP